MGRRLTEADLNHASLAGLLRLAESLNIETKFRSDDTEKSFHRRVIHAILRWEKLYQRGRCT